MTFSTDECKYLEHIYFELDEGSLSELDGQTRSRAELHLASCKACQGLRNDERRLTALLSAGKVQDTAGRQERRYAGSSRAETASWPSGLAVAATLLACLSIVLVAWSMNWMRPAGERSSNRRTTALVATPVVALGSIHKRPVLANTSLSLTQSPLHPSNHVELPAGACASVELIGTGSIRAVGPVVLEVDRVDDCWKISLLSGWINLTVTGEQGVIVASRQGVSELDGGNYVIDAGSGVSVQEKAAGQETSLTDGAQEGDVKQEESVEKILERAMTAFSAAPESTKPVTMNESAELLEKVLKQPDITAAQRYQAGFYLPAALANSEMYTEALAAALSFQKQFPDQNSDVITMIIGDSYWHLGDRDKAMQIWDSMLQKDPNTPYRALIQARMGDAPNELPEIKVRGGRSPRLAPAKKLPFVSDKEAAEFNAGQKNGYLVVRVGLDKNKEDHKSFFDVADQVVRYHNAEQFEFDGRDANSLRRAIATHKPVNVLFVIPPDLLDVNFQRMVFQIAPTLDNDLFADFAWGYLTARDGETLQQFWSRIEGLHKNGLPNQRWIETAVLGGNAKSYTVEGNNSIPVEATAAGFEGSQIYFGCVENEPDVLQFVDANLRKLESASVIAMTGNGDPQGIWLFDDSRNADPARHWQFDPAKVGLDPKNEMLRIRADRFRALNLNSPVIWSGTCHSGACQRVFVESDIVSTFGSSEVTEVYEMLADESLCLSLIDAGAAALLVPIASNHGMAVSMETRFALGNGATLGQAVLSTSNDALFQACGVPPLAIAKAGEPASHFREPIMQGGAANRILIGDPSLKIFQSTRIPGESVSTTLDEVRSRLEVRVNWKKGFHPHAWNMYSDSNQQDYRIVARIEWPDNIDQPETLGALNVESTVTGPGDEPVPSSAEWQVETIAGKTWLHLQANHGNKNITYDNQSATFLISW